MMDTRDAVIFDWNGTLIADAQACLSGTNAALAFLGYTPVSMVHYRRVYNVPVRILYEALGCDPVLMKAQEKEFIEAFRQTYEKAWARRPRLRRGARRTLEILKQQGKVTAVLSNYTIAKIEETAKSFGISSFFDEVLANETLAQAMNQGRKGDKLSLFIKERRIDRAMVVGDTVEEIQIAQEHGCVSVALLHGVCSRGRLKAARPDFLISSLEEIPPIARKVWGEA